MPTLATQAWLADLERILDDRLDRIAPDDRAGFIASDLAAVHRALGRIRERGLARGDVFCEWGSGLGGVCAVAARLGFDVHGIELHAELVHGARAVFDELALAGCFAEGSFLGADDLGLLGAADETVLTAGDGHRDVGLDPSDCDVVFAYPWPGEEHGFDRVFARQSTPGALLVTYHDLDRVLVQRLGDDPHELEPLGWLGAP